MEVHEDNNSNFCMSAGVLLDSDASKFQKMLKVAMRATKLIETKHHTLSSSRDDLGMLIEDTRNNATNTMHTLHSNQRNAFAAFC